MMASFHDTVAEWVLCIALATPALELANKDDHRERSRVLRPLSGAETRLDGPSIKRPWFLLGLGRFGPLSAIFLSQDL
jgi:hypothetical protein